MAITNTPNEVVHQAYKSDKRSWFALKHTHLSSYQPGYEHPDLVVPITGNTTVKLNMSRYLQSAPTVTPLFDSMRVNFRVFFAPQRLYTRGLYGNNFEEVDNIADVQLPSFSYRWNDTFTEGLSFIISRGSLLNRLGYPACVAYGKYILPIDSSHSPNSVTLENAMDTTTPPRVVPKWNFTPLLAYFDIWNHYIRNPYVDDVPITNNFEFDDQGTISRYTDMSFIPAQTITNIIQRVRGFVSDPNGGELLSAEKELFGESGFSSSDSLFLGGIIPVTDQYMSDIFETSSDLYAANFGQHITSTGMLPTNFGEHYQTMFYDDEEINNLNSIVIETDADGNPTVEGLRLGKSVWNRTLRTILKGRKYTDWIDVQFGSKLKISDHPIFVGSDSMLVSFQDVLNQTAPKTDTDPALGKAAGAGARGGKNADSERTIVFTAQEPGYLMVLVDFVPEVSYTDAVPRWLEYETMSSFPMPAYSGMQWQDLKVSDLVFTGTVSDFGEDVIGKQPLYFDYMSSYNRSSALFAQQPPINESGVLSGIAFRSYTFQRNFDFIASIASASGVTAFDYLQSTYIYPGVFDYNFADVGQNGRQNFWMKTEYNLRLYQPLEKQVVSGRI